METVLYEYSFDFLEFLWVLIPLAIGIVCFTCWKWYPKRYEGTDDKGAVGHNGYLIARTIGWVFGSLMIIFGLLLIIVDVADYFDKKAALESGNYYMVEGYTEKYHAMPADGSDAEHFEINGVYFEYSDYRIENGYNRASLNGGVISNNGQHLRIKYVTDGKGTNTILYIERIDE